MLISSLLFTLNKKGEFMFGNFERSEELLAILEEKSGKTTNGLKHIK
jgi:hypothetical protein